MDFEVGKRCALPNCGLRDFLPFPCPMCQDVHCTEHSAPEAHSCKALEQGGSTVAGRLVPRVAPECPACGAVVPLLPGEVGGDAAIARHMGQGLCAAVEGVSNAGAGDEASRRAAQRFAERDRSRVRSHACSFSGCGAREAVAVVCSGCGVSHCLSHRHPLDHECPAERRRSEAARNGPRPTSLAAAHPSSILSYMKPQSSSSSSTAANANANNADSAVDAVHSTNGNIARRIGGSDALANAKERALERSERLAERTDLSEAAMRRRERLQAVQRRMRGGAAAPKGVASNFVGLGGGGKSANKSNKDNDKGSNSNNGTAVVDVDAPPAAAAAPPAPPASRTARLTRMQLRTKATGDKKVPARDRLYFLVVFPRERPVDPKPVFVSKKWTVGRAIDHFATLGRVVNENNKVGGKSRLDLYVGESRVALPTSAQFELLLGEGFTDGDTVTLEREDIMRGVGGSESNDNNDGTRGSGATVMA